MITNLTKQQSLFLEKWKKRSLDIGIDTGVTNQGKAESVITYFYSCLKREKPSFIWCDSPLSANILINILQSKKISFSGIEESLGASLMDSIRDSIRYSLRDSLSASIRDSLVYSLSASIRDSLVYSLMDSIRDSLGASLMDSIGASLMDSIGDSIEDITKYTYTSCWGQQDNYWISFYLFCKIIGVEYSKDSYKLLLKYHALAKSCSWYYPFENVCIVVKKPEICKINNQNRKHNNNGPAIRFRDGFELYALNDVVVPEELVKTPADKLDVIKWVLKEKNVEIRREALRKIGLEKFLKNVPYKTIDKYENYELLEFSLGNKKGRSLKMKNPSIGVYHIEGVPNEMKTCIEALNWRNQARNLPSKLT